MSADPERCEDGPVTPVEFLTARLDELEAVARATQGAEPWHIGYGPETRQWWMLRVLADIAAKRAVIAVHHSFAVEDDGTPDPYAGAKEALWCAGCGFNGIEEYRCRLEECPTLRALVQPFADHPDFDPAWRL